MTAPMIGTPPPTTHERLDHDEVAAALAWAERESTGIRDFQPWSTVSNRHLRHVVGMLAREAQEHRATTKRVRVLPDQWDAVDKGYGLYPEDSAHRDGIEIGYGAAADMLRDALDPS